MNIYCTSSHPGDCAKALDDKRIQNVAGEISIVLCGIAQRVYGITSPYQYRTMPMSNLFVNWARRSDSNYLWLSQHFLELCAEYATRTGGWELPHSRITNPVLHRVFKRFDKEYRTLSLPEPENFVNGAYSLQRGIDFTKLENVHEAYREYLRKAWTMDKPKPHWTNTVKPEWSECLELAS
jgi:hypothetical protein